MFPRYHPHSTNGKQWVVDDTSLVSDRSKEKPRKHITKHWKQLLKRQIIRQRQTTSGGRFMEANSRTYSEALYSQIEDAYGKLLYSYTTQIVEAGRVAKKNRRLKFLNN